MCPDFVEQDGKERHVLGLREKISKNTQKEYFQDYLETETPKDALICRNV